MTHRSGIDRNKLAAPRAAMRSYGPAVGGALVPATTLAL
jgi:hypothetical protein